ncbi:MAG: TIR domain-containing protein [Saprospiraceae bacterium]|nr:TIR domain-containing protein [Saprospiraceae bacterium]
MENTNTLVAQIETLVGRPLNRTPQRGDDPLSSVMPYKENCPKYAVDEDGRLIGLNLADTGIDDDVWQKILALPGMAEHLQALNLSDNKLSTFRFPNGGLRRLHMLNLADNQLKEFALPDGMSALTDVNLEGNPMENPGPEIIRQGKAAVLRFLRELSRQGVIEVFEVKMLIVGEGETGKTTLWKLLQAPDHPVPDELQSTVGIQIKEGWGFEHPARPGEKFLVNLWDFGGQDIQYMTHQFFLTRRSFYVLLADGRRQVANFSYWFKVISLLGCEEEIAEGEDEAFERLPVLVVLNEKGAPITRLPYDPETVAEDYPKLKIIRREVDFKIKTDGRFNALRDTIQDVLSSQMKHLPLKFPANWNEVRLELYRLRETENHIDSARFERICTDCGVMEKQSRQDLSRWLHNLGVILHFQDDPALADFIVLNPQWASNAVYEIMRHKEVLDNAGRFQRSLLRKVWSDSGYSDAEQGKLLNLMLKDNFEVCFQTFEHGREIYIAPQLLPDNRPEAYQWLQEKTTLRYTYQYPFMPIGIIGRLIVRLHDDIEELQGRKMIWVKGAILAKDGCRAQISETDDPQDGRKLIRIEVQGDGVEERKNTLRDIRQELDRIHSRSFPTLKVFQKIPCICSQCSAAAIPREFDVADLRNRSKSTIECPKSSVDIKVRQLLEGFFPEEGRLAIEKKGGGRSKKIFFSYSKHDRQWLDQLLKHLASLRYNERIQPWNDADILPGDDWNDAITRELAEADIIILLVSSDFLATPYIQSVEIKSAMERHEQSEARVIPIILKPCDWQDMPFGKLNGLPFKGQPVSKWADRDDAWLAVVQGIKKIVEDFTT